MHCKFTVSLDVAAAWIWAGALAAVVVSLSVAAAWIWAGALAAVVVSLAAGILAVPGMNAMSRPGFRVLTSTRRAWWSASTAIFVVAFFSLMAGCAAVDVNSNADSADTAVAGIGVGAFPLIFPTCEERLGEEWAEVVRLFADPQIQVSISGWRNLGFHGLVAVRVPSSRDEPGRARVCFFWLSNEVLNEAFAR